MKPRKSTVMGEVMNKVRANLWAPSLGGDGRWRRFGRLPPQETVHTHPAPFQVSGTSTIDNIEEMPAVKRSHDGVEKENKSSASPFMPMFEFFRAELDQHHDRRERVIKASRDITASSKKMFVTSPTHV